MTPAARTLTLWLGWPELVEGEYLPQSKHQCAAIPIAWPASYGQAPETSPHWSSLRGTPKGTTPRPRTDRTENDRQDWISSRVDALFSRIFQLCWHA